MTAMDAQIFILSLIGISDMRQREGQGPSKKEARDGQEQTICELSVAIIS